MRRFPYLLPWLRVELLLRSILTTRWDEPTWAIVRREIPRLMAMRRLGARAITALVVPKREIAWQILALNTEKAHNLREKSLETIRNRIDQFGVSEPIIQRQGQQDILIQLPGIQDPERAKEIISKTALLEFKLVDDTVNLEKALRNETADVGFMGPLQYLLAHEQAGAQAILGEVYNGQPTYTAQIFVRKDSGIRSLADLRGKTMAFVDPLSSSGYLYPLETFRQAGLIAKREDAEQFFRKIYFAGGDEQALRAVLNKFVDAAGIGQYSYAMLRPDEREQVTFIAESPKIPSHCVVARKGLDAANVTAFQEALLALNQGANRDLLKQLYNVDGYVKVTHETFAETERIAREYGFLKGNRR